MTTMTERAYFRWHAQEEVAGLGAVVDLGSWLGSTTGPLAMGLSANPRRAARNLVIHAYDRFIWEETMGYHAPPTVGPYKPGDSFRPRFEQVVKRWHQRIVVHEGDLLRESWTDGPIELLLVDAMKSWDLASHILRSFYPALLPTRGYLIHQDFSHCFTPWIPLTSYRLLDYLDPVTDIPRSESVVFRLSGPVPPLELHLTRASFEESEIEEAFRYWLHTTLPEKHSGLRAARVLLALYDGDAERADWMRGSLSGRGLLGDHHAETLKIVIEQNK
jgi:hypothetical protein